MQSSNLAARFDLVAPDLLIDPPRPKLQLIANTEPLQVRDVRPRISLEFRTIVIRDHGFRSFRVY